MVTIGITPKLGPYGSGMTSVAFEIDIKLDDFDLEKTPAQWEVHRKKLERKYTMKFDKDGNQK